MNRVSISPLTANVEIVFKITSINLRIRNNTKMSEIYKGTTII